MNINIWKLKNLTPQEREKIMRRAQTDIENITDLVRPIIDDVRQNGDDALIRYAAQFDKADISTGLKATDKDFEKAYRDLEPEVIEAIRYCAENVRIHHEQQMAHVQDHWIQEVRPGIYAGEKITAIQSVGVYVPRGKGAFPSMMYMLCMPAKIAGVQKIAVCTPPTPEGTIDAASLVAADICGVRDVYKAGGAQAIAAFAYGTQTIPKVSKVEGPGSPYVAAAKRLLSHVINPGMPAGPTDALILADDSADPWNTALDLINEQEHGPDSASILVTNSESLAQDVADKLPKIINSLPPERRDYCIEGLSTYGGIMICETLDVAYDFCNEYAAEHLLLKVSDTDHVLERIHNAGEILIGETTPMTLGNYGIGANAVLPTGQQALTHSCTSVWSFLKRTGISYVTSEGYRSMRAPVATLAHYEGFTGHAKVLEERNEDAFIDLTLKKAS